MHVPDGFFDAAGAVAAGGVAVYLRGAQRELGDRTAPTAEPAAALAVWTVWALGFTVPASAERG